MRFRKKRDWTNAERCEFRGRAPLVPRAEAGTFGTEKSGPQCMREVGHKDQHIAWARHGQAVVLSQWYSIGVGPKDIKVVIYGGGGGGSGGIIAGSTGGAQTELLPVSKEVRE